jgi:arylsulfatase A-like enzyme
VFLCDLAIECLKAFSPRVMSVDFGEIDCAHYGSWSRYVAAIRQTDELTGRLWQAVQTLPEYRGRTLLQVLPDHGRELERPGGSGFIHHSDFYTNAGADEGCRRVWMLALGPGIRAGRKLGAPVPITAAAATGLEYLGLPASSGAAPSVLKQAL